MTAAIELAEDVGVGAACDALRVSRATFYRRKKPKAVQVSVPSRKSHRALSEEERAKVLDTLNSQRFCDLAPTEVYSTLLDEDTYLCSTRTMYRLLEANKQTRERRDQRHLYVIIDVYSRYVVGWMVAERESAALAKRLIAETIGKQQLDPEQLTVHADRGTSMRSKLVAQLLADLGVTKTHSRPQVSNDNPFSESQFKTLKYRPGFPKRFGSQEDARTYSARFFRWYNHDHHHYGIALLTPFHVHYGHGKTTLEARQRILDAAYLAHPERFSNRPSVPSLPEQVWINPPDEIPDPSPQATQGSKPPHDASSVSLLNTAAGL